MSEISKTVKINIVGDVSSFNQSMESIETKYNQTKQSIENNGINPDAKEAMDKAGSLRYQKDFDKNFAEKYNTAAVDVKSFLDPFFSSLQGVFQSLTAGLEKGSTRLSEQMEKATSKDVTSFTNQYKTNMAIAGALKKDMMDAMDIASSMQGFEREIYNKNKKSIASRVSNFMRTAESTSKSKAQLTDQEVIEQLLGNDSGKSIRSALTSIGLESRDQQERALNLALKTEISRYSRGTFTKAVANGGQSISRKPVSLTDLVPETHGISLLSGGLKKGAQLNTAQADKDLDLAIYRQLQEQVAAGNNSVYKAMKQAGLLVQRPQQYNNQYSHRNNGQRGGEIEWLSEKDLDTRMLDRTFGLLEAERKHAYESSPMWGRKINDPDARAKLLKKEGTAIRETEAAVNLDTRKNSNPYVDAMTDEEYNKMLAGKSYYRSTTAPKAPKLSISEQMQIPNLRFAKDGSKLVAQSTTGSEYLNYSYQRKGVDLDNTKDEWSFVGTNPLLERIIGLNNARKFGNREFGYGRDANDNVIKDTPYFFSQSLDDVYAKDRFGQILYTQDPVTKKSRVELRPEMRELLDSVSGFGARKKAMSFTPQEGAAPIDLTSIVSKAESGGHIYWARTEDLNAIRKQDVDQFGFSMLDFFNEVDDQGRLIDKNGVVIDQNYQGKKSGQQIYAGQYDALGKILSHGENVAQHGGHTPLAAVVDFDAMYEAFGKAGLTGPRGQAWGEDKFKFDGGGFMLPSVYGEDFQARMGPAKFLTQALDFYDYLGSAGLYDFEGNVYAPGVGSGDVINEFSDLLKKRTNANALSADDEKRFEYLRDEYFTTLNRNNPQNIEMLIASSALKNVTKNESVSTGVYEKIRNFVGSNSGYGSGFSLGLEDEKIKARTNNGRVRLTPEDQTTLLAVQSMMSGGLRMMKTDENYVDTQDFISPAFLSNTPVTQAMVEASNENYANAFAAHNSADPSLLINRLFKGQTKLDQRIRENPGLLYTDEEARALVLQDLKTLEDNQLNGLLYMPGRAHHMLGGANPTSVFAPFETMAGKEINPDSVAAQLIAQSGEVGIVNPKTKGTGRGVWTRSPYAWAANFAGNFGSSEKMNEARKRFGMSDAAALFNVEDFYTLNTGDFDGDMAWFYELDDEQYLNDLTRLNKAVRAQETNYNKDQANLKAAGRLPERAAENDITWSGYFQRALGSTPGMGLGYKISQAQRVMDPKYASAYVKFAGNKIYGDAVDERKHGVGAGLAYNEDLKKARESGVTFDRLNKALSEEVEDPNKVGQTDILRYAMPMMHDVLGANILEQAMMGRLSPNGAGYGSARAEAALKGVETRYGNGNATKEEYDFAKWYAQLYGKRITGEQQITSAKDIAEGEQYLANLEARVGKLNKADQSEEAQRIRTTFKKAQGRIGEEKKFGFTESNVPYMGEQYAGFMSKEDRELFDAMVAEQERLDTIANERKSLAPNEKPEDYSVTPEVVKAIDRTINNDVAAMGAQERLDTLDGKTGVLAGGVDIADDKSYIVAKFMKEQEALDQVSSDMFKKQMRIMNTEYSSQGFISKQKNALKDLFSEEDFERLQDYRRVGDVPLMMKDFTENQAKAAQILVKLGEMGDQITENELTDLPVSLSNIKYGQGTLLDKNRSARNLFASIQDDINQTRTQAYLKEDGTYKLSKEDYIGDKGASGEPMTESEINNAIRVATAESKTYEKRMQQLAEARQDFSNYASSMFLQEQINANEEFDNLFGEKTLTRGQTKQRASVSAKAMIEQKNAEYKNLAMKYRLEADKKDYAGNYVYTAEERHAYERSAEEYAKRALRLVDENGMNEDIFNRINEEELKKEENKVEAQRKKAGLSNKLDDPFAARREQIEQARKIIDEEEKQNRLTFQKEDSSYVQMKTLEAEVKEKEKAVAEEKDESKKKQLETELSELNKEYTKAREQYQTGEDKINAKTSLQNLIQDSKSSYLNSYEAEMRKRSAFTIENALSGSAMTKDQYVLNNSLMTKANIEKQIQDAAQSGMITEDQQAEYLNKLNSSDFAKLLDERSKNQYEATMAREARQLDDYIYQNSRRGMSRQMRFSGGQIGRMANQTMMQNESELRQRQSDALYFSSQIKEKTTARNMLDPKKDLEQYSKLTKEISNLTKAEEENNKAMSELENHKEASAVFDSVSESVTKLMGSFGKKMFRQALTEAKQFIKQFDQSMTNIQMITQKTDKQMSTLGDGFIKKAKDLKTSVNSVTAAATDLYRQGLDDDEVNKRLDNIIKFSTVTGINSDVASKIVTTAMSNGLVTNSQAAIDPLVALGDTAATTAAELAKGMQKSAGTANIAKVGYDELLTLLTIGTSKTQLGGNVIGTALNTIFSRLMKTANGDIAIDENGNKVSQSDVATSLKAAGIDIYETGTNKMRGAFDILSELAKNWGNLDDTTKSNIAYNVAGTRQRNNFETLMAGLSEEENLAETYMNKVKDSGGTTEGKYKNYTESLAAANALLTASFDELVASVTQTESFVGFTDFLSNAIQGITTFNKELGGMPGKIATIAVAGTALAAVVNTIGKSFKGTPIGAAITAIEIGAVAVAGIGAGIGYLNNKNKENAEKEKYKEQNTLEENIANQQQRNADVSKKISEAEKLNKEIQNKENEFKKSGKEMSANDIEDLTSKAKDLNSVLLELGVSSADLNFEIDANSLQSWDDLTDKIKEAKEGFKEIEMNTIRENQQQSKKAIEEKFKNGEVSFGGQGVSFESFENAKDIAEQMYSAGEEELSDVFLDYYFDYAQSGQDDNSFARILWGLFRDMNNGYELYDKKNKKNVSKNASFEDFMSYVTSNDYKFVDSEGNDFDYAGYATDVARIVASGNYEDNENKYLTGLYKNAMAGSNVVAKNQVGELFTEHVKKSFAGVSSVDNDMISNIAKMAADNVVLPLNFAEMTDEQRQAWVLDNLPDVYREYTTNQGKSFNFAKYYQEYLNSGIENPYESITIGTNTLTGQKILDYFANEENYKEFNEAYENGNVDMKKTEAAMIADEETKRAQLVGIDTTYKKNKKKNIDDLITLGNIINDSMEEEEGKIPTITEIQEAGIENLSTLMESQAEFNNAYLRATDAEDQTMTADRFKTISDLIVAKQTGLTRNLTQEEAQRIIDLTEGMSAKDRAEFFAADLSSVEQEAMKAAGFGEYFSEYGNMTEDEMQAALDKLKLNEASLKDVAGYAENFGNISSYLTDTSAKGRMDTLAAMALSDAKLSEVQTAAENILSGNMSDGDVRKLAEYYGKDYETLMSNQGLMSSYAGLAKGTVSNKDTAKALFEQMTGVTYDQWKDFANLTDEEFKTKYGEDAFAAAYEAGTDDSILNLMDIIEAEGTTETPLSKALSQSLSARLQKQMPGYLGDFGALTGEKSIDDVKTKMDALAKDADKFEFASTNIDGFAEAFVDLNNAIEAGELEDAQEALKKIDDMKFMGLKEISDADVFNKIKDISTLADLESLQLEDAQMYQRINEVTGGYMLKRAQAEANGEDTSIYDALINDAIANYKISKNTIDNQMLINKGVVSSEVNNWTEMMRNGRAGEIGVSLLTSANGSRNKQAIYNKLAAGEKLTREEQEYLAGQYNIDMDTYGANAEFYNGIFQNDVAMERARTEAGLAQALNDQTDSKIQQQSINDLKAFGFDVTTDENTGKYNVSAARLYNGLTFDEQKKYTSEQILKAAQKAMRQGNWNDIEEDLKNAVESTYKGVDEYLSYDLGQRASDSGVALKESVRKQLEQDVGTTLLDQTADYYSEAKSAYDIFTVGTGKQKLDYVQNIMSQATSYANAQQALGSLDTNKAFEELDSTKLDYIEGVTGWGKNQIKKMWESDPSNAKKILADSMKDSMETISASLEGALTSALGSDLKTLGTMNTTELADNIRAFDENLANLIEALNVSLTGGTLNIGGAEAEETTLGDVITERKRQYVNQSNMMDTLRTISSASVWWNKMGAASDSIRAQYEQALINNPELDNIDQATLDILNKALGGERLTTEEQGALDTFIESYQKERKRNIEYKRAEGISLTAEEEEYEALRKQRELEGQEGLNDVDRAQWQRRMYESMMNGTYGKTFGISDEAMMNDIMSGNPKLAIFGTATTALEAQGSSMSEYLDLAALEERTPEQAARFAELNEVVGGLNLTFSDFNDVATSLAGETLANLIEQTQMYGETSNQVADFVRKNTGTIDDQANALNDLYTQERKVQQLNSVMKAFESGSANKEFDSMFSGYSKQQRAQMLKEGKESLQYKNLEKQRENAQHAYGQMLGQGASDYFKKSMGDGQQLVENLGGEAMDLEVPMTFNIKGGVITNVDMSAFDDGGDADVAAAAEQLKDAGMARIQEFLSQAGFVGNAVLKLVVNESANGDTAAIDVAVEADSTADTTGNPSSGGGGGGGGKSSADLLIEKQQKASKLYEHKMKRLQTKAEDYEQLGEYTNLNEVLQTENDMMKRRMPDVRKNIKQLKTQMKHTKTGSDDWHKLRDALFAAEEEYDNLTKQIHANNKAMEENKKKILETYLALEEAASSLLEAEEQKRREMISSRAQMEQQIFSDIQNSYYKQWELIKEDIEKKKQALQEESSLIDERLQRRKDAEDEARKYEELSELQKQYALISMDSTRTKDSAELLKKINDLQEELGWDQAERAAEIEKKNLSDQVDAYDQYSNDYQKWLDIYLTDANNFADEITEVLEGSSDEIIAWLQKNNEEFRNSFRTTQKDFVEGWRDTIRSMLGETMTFWDLVPEEAKSSKGSYIKFMREHSDEYKNASQERQQLMDLQWSTQFEDWRSSNKLSKGAASYDEKDILDGTNELEHNDYYDKTYYKKRIDGFNGGGKHGYAVEYNKGGTIYSDEKLSQDEYFYETGLKSKKAAEEAAKKKLKEVINADRDEVLARMKREGYSDAMIKTQEAVFKNLYNNYAERILAYREGGDVDYTGLAMVHGTPGKPEAFLDNADREMILNLINGLRYVTVSNAIPFVGSENFSGGNRQSIGDVYVTINEAEISSEEDYSVIAQRVGAEFAKELTKSGFNTSSYSF